MKKGVMFCPSHYGLQGNEVDTKLPLSWKSDQHHREFASELSRDSVFSEADVD